MSKKINQAVCSECDKKINIVYRSSKKNLINNVYCEACYYNVIFHVDKKQIPPKNDSENSTTEKVINTYEKVSDGLLIINDLIN